MSFGCRADRPLRVSPTVAGAIAAASLLRRMLAGLHVLREETAERRASLSADPLISRLRTPVEAMNLTSANHQRRAELRRVARWIAIQQQAEIASQAIAKALSLPHPTIDSGHASVSVIHRLTTAAQAR